MAEVSLKLNQRLAWLDETPEKYLEGDDSLMPCFKLSPLPKPFDGLQPLRTTVVAYGMAKTFCIMPRSSCPRMWQCNTYLPVNPRKR